MRSAGKVSLAVLVSRVLGLVRDQVFAFCFGASQLNDAFQVAFRIPNMLRDLFAEGALSSAFVTVFTRKKAREGNESAWALARLMITIQYVVLGALVILGVLFARPLVALIAHGYVDQPEKFELTVLLTRILFPFILLVGMAALAMGILNTYGRFGLPASASSFFNVGSIVVGLGLALIYDRNFGEVAMICMAIGSVAGGALQWLVQVPTLRRLGFAYRPKWDLRDPGVRDIGRLMAPAIIGVSAVQVNVFINTVFASYLQTGSMVWLAYAFRLIQLPIGMFGVAISTVSLPGLAVDASLFDRVAFRERLERALRLNAAFCIPSAFGLALLSTPLIAVLFQHRRFNAYATEHTASVLIAYALGLIGYASTKVLAPAFYALDRTMTPMCVSLGSIVLTICLNLFFITKTDLGAAGLALTTSLTALLGSGILLAVLSRFLGGMSIETWKAFGKMIVSALVMSGVVYVTLFLHVWFGVNDSFLGDLSRVMVGVGTGGLVYTGMARWLKLDEVLEVERSLLRKLGWNRASEQN